jgi:hypothetical protein
MRDPQIGPHQSRLYATAYVLSALKPSGDKDSQDLIGAQPGVRLSMHSAGLHLLKHVALNQTGLGATYKSPARRRRACHRRIPTAQTGR